MDMHIVLLPKFLIRGYNGGKGPQKPFVPTFPLQRRVNQAHSELPKVIEQLSAIGLTKCITTWPHW